LRIPARGGETENTPNREPGDFRVASANPTTAEQCGAALALAREIFSRHVVAKLVSLNTQTHRYVVFRRTKDGARWEQIFRTEPLGYSA